MGRKSIKENKNIYQISREEAGLTREKASALLEYISPDRIEKIENEKTVARPEEVMTMSKCYKNPSMCNYYCTHECEIGKHHVPEIKVKDIAQITLEMLASLNQLNKDKDRLVEITVDGEISEDEVADFDKIQLQLDKLSIIIDTLNLWVENQKSKMSK